MKVWCLFHWARDAECDEWEQLEQIYLNKPTKKQLQKKLQYHVVCDGFFDTLLEKGEAWGKGYDNWHFSLEERECI